MVFAFKPVTLENREDFVRLFESRGAPGYCWCMVWRHHGEETKNNTKTNRKKYMLGRIDDKIPVGLLAYDGKEPVAWCSVAPRSTYHRLGGEEIEGVEEDKIWSLVCFYIKRDYRRQGLSQLFIKEAAKYAKKNGAKYLEAYPVEPDSPSYHFMGFVPVFKEMDFEFIKKAGSRRNVMLLKL